MSDWASIARRLNDLVEAERIAAIGELEALGQAPVARAVVQAVSERDASQPVRRHAVEALRRMGGAVTEGVELVARELAHRAPPNREAAAWAACVINSPDLAVIVRQKLRSEAEPAVRAALLHALAASGTAADLMVAVPLMEAPEPAVRLAALRAASMLAGADASAYLVRALRDRDEAVRSLATSALETGGWPALRTLLDKMASSAVPWQIESAAIVLGRTRSPDAVPILERLLTHSNTEVRSLGRKGLTGLARSGVEQARALLQQAPPEPGDSQEVTTAFRISKLLEMPGGPEDVRAWARQIVAQNRSERWTELARRLEQESDPAIAAFLVSCLGRLGARASVPHLLPLLAHSEARVRANTVEALRLLARADQLDALLPLLDDPDNRVRANALVALAAHPAVDVPKRLAAMAASSQEPMQLSAVYVAEMLRSPEAARAVERLRESPFDSVRKAYAALPTPEVPKSGLLRAATPLGLGCAGLLAVYLVSRAGSGAGASAPAQRPPVRTVASRPWAPDVPGGRAAGSVEVVESKLEALLLPDRLERFLKDVQGSSTTPESFAERWAALYEVLAYLPESLRLEIASLADMTLLKGASKTHPQDTCARLDDWLKLAARLVLPRLRREEPGQ